MDRIKRVFSSGKKAFIPYITAGYPSTAGTIEIMNILAAHGADIIELGFPFSDPTADGPTIQESSQYALDHRFTLKDYFSVLEKFRSSHPNIPVVIFSYYNPIFHFGIESFVKTVHQLGADAFIIVDLPFEEQAEIRPVIDRYYMHLIQLLAPTTDDKRKQTILAQATGFVYQISLRGVTGTRDTLDFDITDTIRGVKGMTSLPVAVGFGISKAAQIKKILSSVDGIVVGSALVETIRDNLLNFHEPLIEKVRELAQATHSQD